MPHPNPAIDAIIRSATITNAGPDPVDGTNLEITVNANLETIPPPLRDLISKAIQQNLPPGGWGMFRGNLMAYHCHSGKQNDSPAPGWRMSWNELQRKWIPVPPVIHQLPRDPRD